MRKSRFSEAQIIAILKEAQVGASAAEIARNHGISPATFYNWKAKYDVPDASPLKQLRDMAAELAQYKTMYAELAHENFSLRNQLQKPRGKEIKGLKSEAGED